MDYFAKYGSLGLDGGSCVKVFAHQLVSWIEAEARCQSLNGHLITIHSALWNTYLLAITAGLDHPLPYWIGGEWDARVPGQWSWVDGTNWSYENWSEGEWDIEVPSKQGLWTKIGTRKRLDFCAECVGESVKRIYGSTDPVPDNLH